MNQWQYRLSPLRIWDDEDHKLIYNITPLEASIKYIEDRYIVQRMTDMYYGLFEGDIIEAEMRLPGYGFYSFTEICNISINDGDYGAWICSPNTLNDLIFVKLSNMHIRDVLGHIYDYWDERGDS